VLSHGGVHNMEKRVTAPAVNAMYPSAKPVIGTSSAIAISVGGSDALSGWQVRKCHKWGVAA